MTGKSKPKLVTGEKIVLMLVGVALGVGGPLAYEWWVSGALSGLMLIVGTTTLALGLIIVTSIVWWANRPE